MAEPSPCPNCGTLLRLPAGATAARCPKCQTVFALNAEPAAAGPAVPSVPPVPPPPAAPAPAPLPFGRPKAMPLPVGLPASRPVVLRTVEPPPKPEKTSTSPYDEKRVEDEPTVDPEEKRRQLRKELKKLEQEKQAEDEWLAELALQCHRGRISMQLITWAVRLYAVAVLLQMATIGGAALGVFITVSLGLVGSAIFGVLTSITFMVGFGFSIAGPKEVRHLGVMGLVVSILHLILGLIQPGNLAIIMGVQGLEQGLRGSWHEFLVLQDILGISTDFILLADHPARFINRYNNSFPGILVAAAEFTRLVLFSMLGLAYARAGKHPEHGHTCMKAINQLFFIVLLTASFRLAFAAAFDNLNQDDMLAKIGIGIHWALTLGAYISLMLVLLVQSQHLRDTVEVIDHRYLADKRERLDML